MLNTLRRHIARTTIAAATLLSLAVAGATSHPALPAAAAHQDYLFKADIQVTEAFHQQVGGSTFYFFYAKNTGLGSGALTNVTFYCGIRYDTLSAKYWAYARSGYIDAPDLGVNAGQTRMFSVWCDTPAWGDGVTGVHVYGDLQDDFSPNFGITVGYAA